MSDETSPTAPETPANDGRPALSLRAQYIKDLSFENPRAPASIFSLQTAPTMDVSINLGAQKLDEEVYEVALQLSVRAVSDKTTIFLTDLVYAGIFEVRNIPENLLEQAIYIQAAQLLFPFARRVISDVTRDGGFPPLQLEPVDFPRMYAEQRAQAKPAA